MLETGALQTCVPSKHAPANLHPAKTGALSADALEAGALQTDASIYRCKCVCTCRHCRCSRLRLVLVITHLIRLRCVSERRAMKFSRTYQRELFGRGRDG